MSRRKNRHPPQKASATDRAPTIDGVALKAQDSYRNHLARLGFDQPNTSEGVSYPITRLTQNFGLMNSLYRNNWICRRIIDIVPEDMMKNGYKITSQLTPEAIVRIEQLERKTQLRKRVLTGLKWGRLYGGAVGIIAISGQEDMLDQPLNYDTIVPGSFKGIIILDRWTGVQPGLELVGDITDPDFGLPVYYNTYTAQNCNAGRVHHSRVVRFIGRELPFLEEQMEMYWGSSEMEHIYEELKKYDNTSYNIAQLVFMANLRILKMDGLEGVSSVMSDQALAALNATVSAQNRLMNNNSVQVIGAKDDFQTHQYAFSGLPDVFEKFMLSISGAAEIPVTKLFGQAPAGLNATGESDLQNYYDAIEEKQEAYLRPIYDRLLPIMCLSEFGAIPSDLDYEFKPIRRLSDTERVELTSKHTSAIIEAYNAGLISQKMALKEMQQMKETTGAWSNITDQDVERADDSFDLGGEMPGMGGMMPNFNQPQQMMATDADFKEEDHPRAKNGQFGSGGGGSSTTKSKKPIHLETIDFNDPSVVKSTLEKYEQSIVDQDYETAIIVGTDGRVLRLDGEASTVDFNNHDGSLEGCVVTHNHTETETEYSFSSNDFNLFIDDKLSVLRGVDHKYAYEMRKTGEVAPELPTKTLGEMSAEDWIHYKFDARARKEGIYYERKPRGNEKS